MSTVERVREVVLPVLDAAGLELYDLDLAGGILHVLVDRAGGADLEAIAAVSRSISHALDDADLIASSYSLEVSSPGLERPLRTPAHFAHAVGDTVKVKTKPGVEGERRVEGTITGADDTTVTIEGQAGERRTLHLDDIERARTTFEWGAAPKPDRGKARA